jgi:hypothetical protein
MDLSLARHPPEAYERQGVSLVGRSPALGIGGHRDGPQRTIATSSFEEVDGAEWFVHVHPLHRPLGLPADVLSEAVAWLSAAEPASSQAASR